MFLTIAIPTYNRPEQVRNTVVRLLPQLSEEVNLLIMDNCSTVNVRNYLNESIEGFYTYKNVTILRNMTNIGPDANFVKCFEHSTSDYTWTLGDDDEVAMNAVETISNEIKRYEHLDLIGINFNCNLVDRKDNIFIGSIKELCDRLDFFGNWVFISTNVYHTKKYLKHIRYATYNAYSMASQIVPPMIAISQNKTLVLSNQYIVRNLPLEDVNERWSDIKLSLVLGSILETPVGFNDDFKKFGQKLGALCIGTTGPMFSILKCLDCDLDLIDNYHLYIYDQIYYRTIYFRKDKLKARLLFYGCKTLLKNKFLMKLSMRLFKGFFDTRLKAITKFKLFFRS